MQQKLINVRKELGLTQQEMANLVGMSQGGYAKLETGERVGRVSTYKKISKKLKKPISDLI